MDPDPPSERASLRLGIRSEAISHPCTGAWCASQPKSKHPSLIFYSDAADTPSPAIAHGETTVSRLSGTRARAKNLLTATTTLLQMMMASRNHVIIPMMGRGRLGAPLVRHHLPLLSLRKYPSTYLCRPMTVMMTSTPPRTTMMQLEALQGHRAVKVRNV